MQFADGRPPAPTDRIVYVCGSFDLFHIGHLCFLEEALKLGDYLVVGIYPDQLVNEYKGRNYPIMTLHERVLSVLAYKPVSEVIIGAPYEVTQELIDRFHIQVVVQGIIQHLDIKILTFVHRLTHRTSRHHRRCRLLCPPQAPWNLQRGRQRSDFDSNSQE